MYYHVLMSWKQPHWIFNQDHSSQPSWLFTLKEGFLFSFLDPPSGLPVSHLETIASVFYLSHLQSLTLLGTKMRVLRGSQGKGMLPLLLWIQRRLTHRIPTGQQRREGWAAWDEDTCADVEALLFATECGQVSWQGGRTNLSFSYLSSNADVMIVSTRSQCLLQVNTEHGKEKVSLWKFKTTFSPFRGAGRASQALLVFLFAPLTF